MPETFNKTNIQLDSEPRIQEVAELSRGRERVIAAMDTLRVAVGDSDDPEVYYEAADPGYKSSFTRDSMIATLLRGDVAVVRSQIDYSAKRIGKIANPRTGEEPGKAHHELPSYTDETGLSTAYNACDTTAELLRAIAIVAENGDDTVMETHASVIEAGVAYIKRHVNQHGLFIEDPLFSGSTGDDGRQRRFALKVTDWKDSELNRQERREPHYPIVYSLAHFQNADALQRIGRALGDKRLERYGRYMTESGIQQLWNEDHFVTARDMDGVVDAPSDDSLLALSYIAPAQLPAGYATKIEQYMQQLETEAGYRSGIPVAEDIDPYHMGVWTHVQALEHAAALRHNLGRAVEVTERIESFIDPARNFYPEVLNPETFSLVGNPRQLWAIAATLYFLDPARSLI